MLSRTTAWWKIFKWHESHKKQLFFSQFIFFGGLWLVYTKTEDYYLPPFHNDWYFFSNIGFGFDYAELNAVQLFWHWGLFLLLLIKLLFLIDLYVKCDKYRKIYLSLSPWHIWLLYGSNHFSYMFIFAGYCCRFMMASDGIKQRDIVHQVFLF